MKDSLSFIPLSDALFDEIINLAETAPSCFDFECYNESLELVTSKGTLFILKKPELEEIWVSNIMIGSQRFCLDLASVSFRNKKKEELMRWLKQYLSS